MSRLDAWRASGRRVTRIALTEANRTRGSFDRKSLLVIVVMALLAGALMPYVSSAGFDFDHGLYRAAVSPDSPLMDAVVAAPVFSVTVTDDPLAALRAGTADIALDGARIHAPDSEKGDAAIAAVKQAAKDYTYALMAVEPDDAAAFPVRVVVAYEEQAVSGTRGGGAGGAGLATDLRDRDGAGSSGSGGTSTGGSTGGGGGKQVESGPSSGFTFLPPERSVATPETLAPPFPFRSLILAYLFLIPMNFVVQVYAGSMINERLNRKGEALLASPAGPWEIITGKTMPYFLGMMAVSALIAVWLGGGWLTVLAVAPLALAFLAMEFVAAMFARSFRELTFLTVFTSVLLTIYAFLPAVFTNVHPVALVSPITLAVMDLRGLEVGLGEILYGTLPLTLASLVLFVLGAALYREEDLFHQKPVFAKAVDMVARQVRGTGSGFRISVILLPLVLVGELLLITFLFAWPVQVGLIGVLLAVAFVEECFKGIPSYAAFTRGVVPVKRALVFGALVGLGFFVAEKGFLIASLAGLPASMAGGLLLAAGLLLAPLVLHVATAALSAWGAAKDRQTFVAAFTAAVLIHTAYNYTVVTLAGGI